MSGAYADGRHGMLGLSFGSNNQQAINRANVGLMTPDGALTLGTGANQVQTQYKFRINNGSLDWLSAGLQSMSTEYVMPANVNDVRMIEMTMVMDEATEHAWLTGGNGATASINYSHGSVRNFAITLENFGVSSKLDGDQKRAELTRTIAENAFILSFAKLFIGECVRCQGMISSVLPSTNSSIFELTRSVLSQFCKYNEAASIQNIKTSHTVIAGFRGGNTNQEYLIAPPGAGSLVTNRVLTEGTSLAPANVILAEVRRMTEDNRFLQTEVNLAAFKEIAFSEGMRILFMRDITGSNINLQYNLLDMEVIANQHAIADIRGIAQPHMPCQRDMFIWNYNASKWDVVEFREGVRHAVNLFDINVGDGAIPDAGDIAKLHACIEQQRSFGIQADPPIGIVVASSGKVFGTTLNEELKNKRVDQYVVAGMIADLQQRCASMRPAKIATFIESIFGTSKDGAGTNATKLMEALSTTTDTLVANFQMVLAQNSMYNTAFYKEYSDNDASSASGESSAPRTSGDSSASVSMEDCITHMCGAIGGMRIADRKTHLNLISNRIRSPINMMYVRLNTVYSGYASISLANDAMVTMIKPDFDSDITTTDATSLQERTVQRTFGCCAQSPRDIALNPLAAIKSVRIGGGVRLLDANALRQINLRNLFGIDSLGQVSGIVAFALPTNVDVQSHISLAGTFDKGMHLGSRDYKEVQLRATESHEHFPGAQMLRELLCTDDMSPTKQLPVSVANTGMLLMHESVQDLAQHFPTNMQLSCAMTVVTARGVENRVATFPAGEPCAAVIQRNDPCGVFSNVPINEQASYYLAGLQKLSQ